MTGRAVTNADARATLERAATLMTERADAADAAAPVDGDGVKVDWWDATALGESSEGRVTPADGAHIEAQSPDHARDVAHLLRALVNHALLTDTPIPHSAVTLADRYLTKGPTP